MYLLASQRLALQIKKLETSETQRKQDHFIPRTRGVRVYLSVCLSDSSLQQAALR